MVYEPNLFLQLELNKFISLKAFKLKKKIDNIPRQSLCCTVYTGIDHRVNRVKNENKIPAEILVQE